MSDLLTLDDLAKRLGCSPRTARYLVYGDKKRGKEPEIPSFLVGEKMRRVDPAEVERYVRAQQARARLIEAFEDEPDPARRPSD